MTAEKTNASLRILLVEDHEMVAESLGVAISREPDLEVVETASTLADAVAALETTDPDVVLADYRLPDGTGADLARRLSDRDDLPVVMLTGAGGDDVLVEAVQAGCAGFLDKSRPVRDVVDAVRAAASGEAYFDAVKLARLLDRIRNQPHSTGGDLTRRELEVLGMLSEGMSTQAITDTLVLSRHTVRNHIRNILTKLNAHSKLEAVAIAAREGIIDIG